MNSIAWGLPKVTKLVNALVFLGGFATLALELLQLRGFTTFLGDGLEVHISLVATYLVGLAAGAYWAQKLANKLGVGFVALGIYSICFWPLLTWLSKSETFVSITASAAQSMILVATIAILPSILLGSLLPLASQWLDSNETNSFSKVYLAFNCGALSGLALTEFFLIRTLGMNWSFALLGILFFALSPLAIKQSAAPLEGAEAGHFSHRVLLAVALLGMASSLFQGFFLKTCLLVFYPHRENFALALSLIFVGLSLGVFLVRKFPLKFTHCALGAALSLALTYNFFATFLRFFYSWGDSLEGKLWLVPLLKLVLALVLGLLTATCFGASLPALHKKQGHILEESGQTLAVSGLANSLGYVLYTLYLHQALSQDLVLALICFLCLVAAALSEKPTIRSFLVPTLIVAASCLSLNHTWQESHFYLPRFVGKTSGAKVLTFKSGPDSATLWETPKRTYLSYNGHNSIDVLRNGRANYSELLVGSSPALYSANRDKALVIGLGSGLSTSAALAVFKEVDVIELNPAMIELSRHLGDVNHNLLENPRLQVHLGDARAFLNGKRGVYDAIISTTGDATYYSTAKLQSQEFYQQASGALKPGGVFCLWLSREYSGAGMEIVIASLNSVFSHCALQVVGKGYYQLICSREQLKTTAWDEIEAAESLEQDLKESFPEFELKEVFDGLRLSRNIFAKPLPFEAHLNSDNKNLLEFVSVSHHRRGIRGWNPFLEYRDNFQIELPKNKKAEQLHRQMRTRFAQFFSD